MENKIPVVVFAYKRVDLLTQLLESLKEDAIPLLYVFCDGSKNDEDKSEVEKVRAEVDNIDWCEKIVTQHPENLGLGKSVLFGANAVLTKHEAAIFFEDDLICVKGTYNYLKSALHAFEKTEKVMSVTGWTHPNITPKNLNEMPYFDGKAECWCWGTWARAWNGMEKTALEIYNDCLLQGIDVEKYGSDLPKMALEAEEKNLWAIRWWYLHILKGGLCLRPPHSLVETTGWDGRGTTITPAMMEWKNPPLKKCPPIPANYPLPSENSDCAGLWRIAIDQNAYHYATFVDHKVEAVKKGIWMCPTLLTHTECDYLLLKAKENIFNKANNGEKYGRNNRETFIKQDSILNLIRSRLKHKFLDSFSSNDTTEILEFYLYNQGDFVKQHSDAPSKISNTLFSSHTLVIYLNNEFEGGETYFSEDDFKIRVGKGGAILFDQSLSHGGALVTQGEKYILRLGVFVQNLNT